MLSTFIGQNVKVKFGVDSSIQLSSKISNQVMGISVSDTPWFLLTPPPLL